MIEEFKKMADVINVAFRDAKSMMAYCDYIATLISANLKFVDNSSEKLLSSVGKMQYDLSSEGSFASTKKTIAVEDRFGKKYRITVEEIK